MQIYSKSHKKCFISQPILIWFALSHRANWGLQNFYTEFQNSLIMQIYAANLCKFIQNHKKCLFFICQLIFIWFALSGRTKFGTPDFYTEFRNFAPYMLIIVIYAN